ncbi:MAG: fused MFS/spermidine synthase [Pseudomonadales bacterium]|nr:fused MFS/spermidine synthase [Pseudomonadales bacterium]
MLNAVQDWTLPRQIVTQLYGWNTIGAAVGAFLTGFFLIWQLGLTLTVSIAVGLNLIVALLFYLMATQFYVGEPSPVRAGHQEEESTQIKKGPREQILWCGFAFISGFSVLAYEILWGRMAKFLLGDRTIAITALLFIFIICLGLGSLLAPTIGQKFKANTPAQALKLMAWIFIVAGFLHLAIVPLASTTIHGDGLASIIMMDNEFIRRILTMWILIFPPIIALGLVFPLLLWSAREIDILPGKVLGNLYFINTVGAMVGAVVASFALSRWLGTLWAFLFITGLQIVCAAIYLLWTSKVNSEKSIVVLAVIFTLVIAVQFPKDLLLLRNDEKLVDYSEDEYGVQSLTQTESGMLRVKNNRLQLIYDLGHPQTTHAQQMAAHLTTLFAKECCDVLNVGTGYGITAGTYTLYSDVDSIETIEILPFLVRHQNTFSKYNFSYLQDARVQLVQGDGRHILVASDKTYDIISVNVLDPYLPGSASLYTVDLWQEVYDHLRPGGVYTQLFWGDDVSLLIKGLNTVFPTVLYFSAYGNTSLNVIGFKNPVTPETAMLHLERIDPNAKIALQEILDTQNINKTLHELLATAWENRGKLNKLAEANPSPLHTDDFPILEFRWAHGVEHVSVFDSPLVE